METLDALERSFWFVELCAFLLGLCVGSFLNVVIARLPEGLSVVRPASRCPKCGHQIAWYDNLPLVSWLALRGRCRGCGAPISIRYPVVELLVGLLALAIVRRWGLDLRTPAFFTFAALLVAIAYIDLDHWIIPHELTWSGIVLGLLASAVNPDLSAVDAALGAVVGFFVFAVFAFLAAKAFKKEALGAGDWWLLAMIGAWLGWQELLAVVLLASLQGAVVGILLILIGRSEPGEGTTESAEEESPEPEAKRVSKLPPPLSWPLEFWHFLKGQTIGDGTEEAAPEEPENWTPPRHAVPFGPFLALAALELLLVGEWLKGLYDRLLVSVFS